MERSKSFTYLRCFFCWECCFTLNERTQEILGQVTILFLMGLSCFLIMLPQMDETSIKFPGCRISGNSTHQICLEASGAVAAYRLSLAFFLFYAICFTTELFTKIFSMYKGYPLMRLWFTKFVIIISLSIGASFIPPSDFDIAWTYFLMFASMIFIVIQMYSLIRVSYALVIYLKKKVDKGSKIASKIQVALFASCVIISVIGNAVLIYYFPLCNQNMLFLLSNVFFPFIACLWTSSDCVRTKNGYSGYIQGSLLTCFITVYTWLALTSNPDPNCNPYFSFKEGIEEYKVVILVFVIAIYAQNMIFPRTLLHAYIGEKNKVEEECVPTDKNGKNGETCEETKVQGYNAILGHIICALGVCFMVISFMSWSPPNVGDRRKQMTINAMWFKMGGCWFSLIFFAITLYTPKIYGIKVERVSDC